MDGLEGGIETTSVSQGANTEQIPETKVSESSGFKEKIEEKLASKEAPLENKSKEAAMPSPYQPNYKIKAWGKEYEIDDWARPYIKDQDTEKKAKEFFEKAYGLDEIKPRYQSLKEQHEFLSEEANQLKYAVETVGQYAREKKFDKFFDTLNIPKRDILEYALELVGRENMTPEQKIQWEKSQQSDAQAEYVRQQSEQLRQSQLQFEVQRRSFELDNALRNQDVLPVMDAFNQAAGDSNAFRNYVIKIGLSASAQGHDMPVAEAVEEAMKTLRFANPSLGSRPQSNVVAPNSKPVIPNIQGRGTSPVKKAPRSLQDLKDRAKELNQSY